MSFFIVPHFFKSAIQSFTPSEAADSVGGDKIYYLFIIVFLHISFCWFIYGS